MKENSSSFRATICFITLDEYRIFAHHSWQMLMLTKNKIKDITALQQKKYREESGLFLVEGDKMVQTLLEGNFEIVELFALPTWIGRNNSLLHTNKRCAITEITEQELSRISALQTPNQVVAVARIPQPQLQIETLKEQLCLVLDNVQDPGNMGTIIRLADWFGIRHIVCSVGCVDVFNPKVVQSTMGALAKTTIHYTSLPEFIKDYTQQLQLPVYGTFLNGNIIYSTALQSAGLIVMGNEGNGISPQVEALVSQRLFIPSFGTGSESLNVATAAAIVCSEFRRRV